jgi:hypothetical protein
MYKENDYFSDTNLDQFYFPLYITNGTADEICIEEVRCRQYTVGRAYNYYIRKVVHDPLCQTMISVFLGDYKSTCFNMSCFMLETERSKVPEGCLYFDHEKKGTVSILARGQEATASLLEAMCVLSIDPIVSSEGEVSLEVLDDHNNVNIINVCMSGFSNKNTKEINVLGSMKRAPDYVSAGEGSLYVRAVRTALVTMSVVLTPKSLYGGKNPTTKVVTYYVHNVKVQ